MITVYQSMEIKFLKKNGQSIHSIVSDIGTSRNTVPQALRGEHPIEGAFIPSLVQSAKQQDLRLSTERPSITQTCDRLSGAGLKGQLAQSLDTVLRDPGESWLLQLHTMAALIMWLNNLDVP